MPFDITVIHTYAPTASSSDEDIESFYSDVEDALTQTDKKDIIILTGDWNAKVGQDRVHVPKYNGYFFIDFFLLISQ